MANFFLVDNLYQGVSRVQFIWSVNLIYGEKFIIERWLDFLMMIRLKNEHLLVDLFGPTGNRKFNSIGRKMVFLFCYLR